MSSFMSAPSRGAKAIPMLVPTCILFAPNWNGSLNASSSVGERARADERVLKMRHQNGELVTAKARDDIEFART